MKKNKKLYVKILLVIVISVSCNKNSSELSDITIKNKFQKAKIEFEKAKDIYDNCKTEYEYLLGNKIVLDIKNGSGIKGVAKQFSDYLKDKCYDTFYSNWNNFNEYKTYIILHRLDNRMAIELKQKLDAGIPIEIIHDEKKNEDMTIIIGKDYKNLEFYRDAQNERQ